MKKLTNFDRLLKKEMKDPAFAEDFREVSEAWDVAVQLCELREKAGLSQAALARKVKTSQQQICRLESANYQGHSLRMLRRVAKVLHAQVHVVLQPLKPVKSA